MNDATYIGSKAASICFAVSPAVDTPVATACRSAAASFDERSLNAADLIAFQTLILDVDLGDADTIRRTRHLLAALPHHLRLVFAVDRGPRRHQQTVQANAL